MLLSDLVLGLHLLLPVVYGSLALIVCLGFWVRRQPGVSRIGLAAVAGAFLFFIVTNFGVWAIESYYPKTGAGLVACYVEAIPFFWNTVISDVLFSAALFGLTFAVEKRWESFAERCS